MTFGEPRIHVDSCASTQELLDPSMPEGAVATADFQTSGRGRFGRSWEAPPGDALLASVLLHPPADRPLPQLALVAGVAVADALERLTGLAVQIKWPNDVMLRRTKVAGILAEARDGAVVLGIGVNLNQTRDRLPERAGSLRTQTGLRWDRDEVLDAVLADLGLRYDAVAYRGSRRGLRRPRRARLPARAPGRGRRHLRRCRADRPRGQAARRARERPVDGGRERRGGVRRIGRFGALLPAERQRDLDLVDA